MSFTLLEVARDRIRELREQLATVTRELSEAKHAKATAECERDEAQRQLAEIVVPGATGVLWESREAWAKSCLKAEKERDTLRSQLQLAKEWLEADDQANNKDNYPLRQSGPDYPMLVATAREKFRQALKP